MTGGVTEPVDLEAGGYAGDDVKRDELFKTLKKSSENRALMAAAIPVSDVTRQHYSLPSRLDTIRSMIARFLGQVQRRDGKSDG